MNETVNTLTKQRERLDAIKIAIGKLPKSRGNAIAFTSLEKGRMYIGEICRELGKSYPYEATKTATTAEGIQDAVDISVNTIEVDTNEIVALNNFRELLNNELKSFEVLVFEEKGGIPVSDNARDRFVMNCVIGEAYRGLKETRMWLGIRLGELRDEVKNNEIPTNSPIINKEADIEEEAKKQFNSFKEEVDNIVNDTNIGNKG